MSLHAKMSLGKEKIAYVYMIVFSMSHKHAVLCCSESTGFDGWTFTSSKFWGETPAVVWILNITDTNSKLMIP